jgi:hypothetical protein
MKGRSAARVRIPFGKSKGISRIGACCLPERTTTPFRREPILVQTKFARILNRSLLSTD